MVDVPRSQEPSAATQQLIKELAGRDLSVGWRAIESWAARGLAPAPVRRSLGKGRGTASEYPPGAADQYAAVAGVMRRGCPWQVSVVKLVVRGRLPTDERLVRQALRELLAPDHEAAAAQDALGYAERVAADVAHTPMARPFLRAYERNLKHSASILEPGTEIGSVAVGVLATLVLARLGEPEWSPEALIELLAAHGIPVADLPEDDRAGLARLADGLFVEFAGAQNIAKVADETPMDCLLAAIPHARSTLAEALAGLSDDLPKPGEDIADVLTVFCALMQIRIDDLGGDDAIAGLAQQLLEGGATSVSVTERQAMKPGH